MSSDDIAIRVENLSKCYTLYDAPRDRLKQFLLPRLARAVGRQSKQYFREFWALDDISLTIRRGEILGIIGRNGSGKSTLLQLICGTLSPTHGEVEVIGRIAALLELGAGFNPEFTGKENVLMSASILGLSPQETKARYGQIAAFADIGEFIDQPVKTYSSGMFVRLAFAVAVHVEPSILIIDEALSVGDISFQNKCVLKIKELHRKGVTLLFVSHDLSTLQMICNRVLWLVKGRMAMLGNPVAICQSYQIAMTEGCAGEAPSGTIAQQSTGMAEFVELGFLDLPGNATPVFGIGDAIHFRFTIKPLVGIGDSVFAISIYRSDGDWIIGQTSRESRVVWPPARAGQKVTGTLVLEPNCLAPGDYKVAFGAYSEDLALCFALSELTLQFSVRSAFPTWGKVVHPARWILAAGE